MRKTLDDAEVELIYDELAHAIDRVPMADERAFLASLSLLLSHRLGDIAVVRASIAEALGALAVASRTDDTG